MRQPGDQYGSAAIEAAVAAPAFVLFVGLIIFGGRTAIAHQAVESAAADAARAASLARTASAASKDAQAAAQSGLSAQGARCGRITVSVDTEAFGLAVGQNAEVSVTVSCLLDLADLSVPGIPGSRPITATMTSPLDTWRERS